ncbi:23S rRNA (adenine(2503)-C(2))-methyltransferase RlmN [Dermatophilus congolensis]|uniref:23S rRNA (adenine(2503)-C(2))-methyltransferase RlmN n=1 Tax=Dermatophilus congolensis TaxID=1863 RepID=UPI001AAF5E77|nr:23S rRNA (adenine(2503)-C(2))-methyltransferase RlmN [Dermatophilus congolensis]MBO3142277.1 23S rRNA (adenine(2503)-C(2))-methyltransferase RlmN [Dermatophilus congolensis]MBO3151268.1 23S rRNA (adenine(2503)-C(2))-methyltransferase RlmN [Dermatophilus congolensis]MBO3161728.1 23S rRNA (adenine(2503)-C(2))-methyltransferase RlmN [Dermatophilus congolensis]MBO3162554.1 23S rRNA (adenine(2503)-C(2))-methyltransferase RlmN [Dermatophilus congolensis]MBO3176107.1 23S rRNA (adenine(2503)-C(2))-
MNSENVTSSEPLQGQSSGAQARPGLARRRPGPGQITLSAPGNPLPRTHLADLDMAGRVALLKEAGYPGFRAKQLSTHYFSHFTTNPESMTDLPQGSRSKITEAAFPSLLENVRDLVADNGRTVKSVWRLHDGALVESVLMRYPRRVTMCISSQAGCGMNCPFCATGQEGFTRNLSTAEIVEQVRMGAVLLRSGRFAGPEGGESGSAGAEAFANPDDDEAYPLADAYEIATAPLRVSNVVFMGMGEALVNYKRAVAAIRRLIAPAPEGFGMSARGITMSSVGLVPGINRLAAEGLPVTLALSLHAPDDDLRDELVPINNRYKVAEALDAARAYFDATGRRVSIEYALIRDMNDQAWRADLLGEELTRRGKGWVHVNPIPLNPTPGSKWTASRPGVMQQFVERLRAHGVPTTIRDTRGSDIDGACGQLAAATS